MITFYKIRVIIPIVITTITALLPVPEGLTFNAWMFFSVFLGFIASLITQPLPSAVCGLCAITISIIFKLVSITSLDTDITAKEALLWGISGLHNPIICLLISAFVISLGFQNTQLGRRIALWLVTKIGRTPMGLGYAFTLVEVIIAPFISSSTARSGGIIIPLMDKFHHIHSIKQEDAYKLYSYLSWCALSASCVASSIFMTGLASNLLAVSIVRYTTKIDIDWMDWFTGFLPAGIILILFLPFINFLIIEPKNRSYDEIPEKAQLASQALGPISIKEYVLIFLCISSLMLWIFGNVWITTISVGIATATILLAVGIVKWQEVISYSKLWDSVIWFATSVSMATGLVKTGLLSWFASHLCPLFDLFSTTTTILILITTFFFLHYFFFGIMPYIAIFLPIFMSIALGIPEIPMQEVSLLFCFSIGLMGISTPFASNVAFLWNSSRYISEANLWRLGAINSIIFFGVLLFVVYPSLIISAIN